MESRTYVDAWGEPSSTTKNFTLSQTHNRVPTQKITDTTYSPITYSPVAWSARGQASISTNSRASLSYRFHRDDEVSTAIAGDQTGLVRHSTTQKLTDGIGRPPSDVAPLIDLPGGLAVSAASGNVLLSIPVVPVVNDLPGLTLTYNSQEGFDHGYGCGWRTNWDLRVVSSLNRVNTYEDGTVGTPAILIDESGARVPIGGPRRGATYTLGSAREPGGTTLSRGDGTWLDFDADGWLVCVRFPDGVRTWTVERAPRLPNDPGFRPVMRVRDSRSAANDLELHPATAPDVQRLTGMRSLVRQRNRTWSTGFGAGADAGAFAAWSFTYHGADQGYALASVRCTGSSADVAGLTVPELAMAIDYSLVPVNAEGDFDPAGPTTQSNIPGYARCTTVRYGGESQYSIAYEKITTPNTNVVGIWPAVQHTRTTLTDPQGAVTVWRLRTADAWDSIRDAAGVERRQQVEDASGRNYNYSSAVLRNLLVRRWTQVGSTSQDVTTTRYDASGRPDRIVYAPGTTSAVTVDQDWNLQAGIPAGMHVLNRRTTYAVNGVDGCGPVEISEHISVGISGPAAGRIITAIGPDNLATRLAYAGQGLLDSVTDVCGNLWDYSTNAAGLRSLPTTPAGRPSQVRTVAGIPALAGTIVGHDGVAIASQYDPDNNATSRTVQGLAPETAITSPLGLLVQSTSRTGEVRSWTYDALLRPTRLRIVPSTTVDAALKEGHSAPTLNIPDETWDYVPEGTGLKVTHKRGDDVLAIVIQDGAGRIHSRSEKRSGGYGRPAIEVTSTMAYQPSSNRIASITADGIVAVPTYDGLGRIAGWSESAGGRTRHRSAVHNALGWRLSATDANGLTTRWTYDRQGNVVRTINPAGGWHWVGRDEAGRETMRRTSQGAAETTERDADGEPTRQRDRDGVETTHAEKGKDGITDSITTRTCGDVVVSTRGRRDATARSAMVITQVGRQYLGTRTTQWLADGLPRTRTAPGEPTQETAWAAGVPWQTRSTVALPGGGNLALVNTQALTTDGRPGTATDGFGSASTATPDAITGAVDESVQVVAGAVRTVRVMQRDAYGRPLRVQTSSALAGRPDEVSETRTTYDAFGRVETSTGADGVTDSYTYDLGGRTLTHTRPGQGTTTCTYDVLGNATVVTDGAGRTLRRTYDAIGRLINEQRGSDVTSYDYDVDTMRLRRTIEPGQRITTYAYDAQGLLQTTTRPGGQVIRQEWDALGRRTRLVHPAGPAESWTYVGDTGRIDTRTDRFGRVWTYTYTSSGELASLSMANGTTLTWTVTAIDHDGAKLQRVITEAGASGTRTETVRLDAAGRILSRSLPGSVDISYAYDAAGRVLQRGDLTYSYDAAGRLATAGHEGRVQVTLEYDADTGLLYRQYLPQNLIREMGYDAGGLPSRVSLSGAVSASWTAERDATGRLLRVVEPDGAVTYTYQAGRVIHAARTGTSAYDIAWTTDARGNRTVRDVYTALQAYDLAFTADGVLPERVTADAGTWTVADGRLSVAGSGSAQLALGAGALPRLSWWWAGEAMVVLRDAAGTWVELRREDDGRGLVRVVVYRAAGDALAATTWQSATAMSAVEVVLDAHGGLSLRCGSDDVSATTALTGVAGVTLEGGSTGASFDQVRWETAAQRERTVTTPDLQDRPALVTETTTDADGAMLAERTTRQAFDVAGRLATRTVQVNQETVATDTATWDDLDRMATWASASGSTAFTYRPGTNVPMSDTITWGANSPVQRSYTADEGGILAIDGVRYGVIGRTPLWENAGYGVVALPGDLQGHIAGRVGRLAGIGSENPAVWLQRTIYHPDGRSLTRTAHHEAELGIAYSAFTPGIPVSVGYRGMYRHPQVGQYRTDNRWLDVDIGAFTSADPAWPGTGDSQYAYCGGDPVNRWDPSGLAAYFFDGTNNNGRAGFDEGGTNVWALFLLNAGATEPVGDEYAKHYYGGVGNAADFGPFDGKSWSRNSEIAGGAWGRGLRAIIEDAVADAKADAVRGDKTVDIFGFSRGSAAALEFARRVREEVPDADIRFIGVFDVVAAMGGNHDAGDLHLRADDVGARSAYHAIAMDETRTLFQVTDVAGAEQQGFRGAHSDVGGGYRYKGLSNIALHAMLGKAQQAGVPMLSIEAASALDPRSASTLARFSPVNPNQTPHRQFDAAPGIPYEHSPRRFPAGVAERAALALGWQPPTWARRYEDFTGRADGRRSFAPGRRWGAWYNATPFLNDTNGETMDPFSVFSGQRWSGGKAPGLVSEYGLESMPYGARP